MERVPASTSARDDWWWVFDPRLSLRARAVLVVGGGALLFVVLVSWLAGAILQRQLETQVGRTFESLAFQVSDKLDRNLYERFEQLQFAASLAPFRTAEATNTERRHVLEAALDSASDFAWLGFADPQGTITIGTQGMLENTSVAERPWFRAGRVQPFAASAHEIPDLARLDPQGTGGGPARFIDFAVPLTTAQGQFLGVLAAEMRWPAWGRLVQASVVPESAARERIGVTIYDATGGVLLDSGGSGWTEPPPAPQVKGRRGVLLENAEGGVTYAAGFARSAGFREFRGFDWLIVVRQPWAEAFAPVRELRGSLLRWGILFGGALILATWIAAGRLAHRMSVVTKAAKRIQGGDILTTLPRPNGSSEVERMCVALNDMTEDLRAKQIPPVAQPPPSEKHPW